MIRTESYLAVLLVVLESAEGCVGLSKLWKVLSDAEGILCGVTALEHEYLRVGAVDTHDVVVDGLADSDRVGSSVQDHEVLTIPDALDVSDMVC